MIKYANNNDYRKLRIYTYCSYVSTAIWIACTLTFDILSFFTNKTAICGILAIFVTFGIDTFVWYRKSILEKQYGVARAFLVNGDNGKTVEINRLKIDKVRKFFDDLGIEYIETTEIVDKANQSLLDKLKAERGA